MHPHEFIVDLGAVRTLRGVAFKNRSNLNGALKNIEIYSSNDNVSWELIKSTQLSKVFGSWLNVDLDNNLDVQYLKVKSINSWGDFNYTHLNEFGAY